MTQKITMGRDKRQDLIDAQAAIRNGNANPFIAGVQSVYSAGSLDAVKASRTNYGTPTITDKEVMLGKDNNFAQKDAPINAVEADALNSTATLALGTSATRNANMDPEAFQTDALEKRLELYRHAGSNVGFGNNDRSQTMRLA